MRRASSPGMTVTAIDRNRRKLYGRRKGPKLSARQAGLRRTLLRELALDCPGGDPRPSFRAVFDEVWLEVGFGAGEHLVWQAARTSRMSA